MERAGNVQDREDKERYGKVERGKSRAGKTRKVMKW
jgi:hypothetical protein